MNLEQVSHYIAHPQELGLNEASALKELSAKHPYAAIFSLLYLTALSNGKSVDLDAALQQHAYRLSDRTKLYHLVHNSVSVSEPPQTVAEEIVSEEIIAEIKLAEPEPVSEKELPSSVEEDQYAPQLQTAEETPEIVSEEEMQSFEAEQPETAQPVAIEEEEEDTAEQKPFDRITEAFTREQHFDISTDEPVPTEIVEEIVVPEHLSDEEPEIVSPFEAGSRGRTEDQPLSTDPEIASEEPQTSHPSTHSQGERPETSPSPRSFTSWLKSAAEPEEKPVVSVPQQEIIPEKKTLKTLSRNNLRSRAGRLNSSPHRRKQRKASTKMQCRYPRHWLKFMPPRAIIRRQFMFIIN
jgi:hypothetical protein